MDYDRPRCAPDRELDVLRKGEKMPDESVATIIIERPTTDGLGFPAALVVVDGQVIGRLKKGRPAVFAVPPGDRLVTVWPANLWGEPIDPESLLAQVAEEPPASIRLRLEPGGRAELLCQSNQPRLHPLVWYAGGFFILVAVLGELGRRFPAVRAAQDSLAVPLLVAFLAALVLGPVGLVIWLRRAWRAGGFRGTVVSLTLKSGAGVSVREPSPPVRDGGAEPGAAADRPRD
jgi:hypothetical protein